MGEVMPGGGVWPVGFRLAESGGGGRAAPRVLAQMAMLLMPRRYRAVPGRDLMWASGVDLIWLAPPSTSEHGDAGLTKAPEPERAAFMPFSAPSPPTARGAANASAAVHVTHLALLRPGAFGGAGPAAHAASIAPARSETPVDVRNGTTPHTPGPDAGGWPSFPSEQAPERRPEVLSASIRPDRGNASTAFHVTHLALLRPGALSGAGPAAHAASSTPPIEPHVVVRGGRAPHIAATRAGPRTSFRTEQARETPPEALPTSVRGGAANARQRRPMYQGRPVRAVAEQARDTTAALTSRTARQMTTFDSFGTAHGEDAGSVPAEPAMAGEVSLPAQPPTLNLHYRSTAVETARYAHAWLEQRVQQLVEEFRPQQPADAPTSQTVVERFAQPLSAPGPPRVTSPGLDISRGADAITDDFARDLLRRIRELVREERFRAGYVR